MTTLGRGIVRRALALALLAAALTLHHTPAVAQSPPDAPESVTVTRSDGALTADWPAVDGATSYHVTYIPVGETEWRLAALHHPDAAITIDGIDNDAMYIVGVRARNEVGDSAWTNSPAVDPYVPPVLGPTPTPTPDARTQPHADTHAHADAHASRSPHGAHGDGGRRQRHPGLERPVGLRHHALRVPAAGRAAGGDWSAWTHVFASGAATTSYVVPGLANGAEYRFRVRAVSAAGASGPAPNADPDYVAATPTAPIAQAQQEDGARIASDNDSDDDNLIEVTTVAQFIAMQWDLNGDGTPESETTKYNTAFDSGVSGCSSTCAGYEITADLTITANPTDAGTSYLVPGDWNTTFQGNGNTITNNDSRPLFQNIGATTGSTKGEIKGLNVDNSGAGNAILADKVQAQGVVTNTGVTGR